MSRILRDPHPSTAALVRLAAFLVAAASVLIVPAKFAAAAAGHSSVPDAFAWAALATISTVAMTLVARGLDPMRRR